MEILPTCDEAWARARRAIVAGGLVAFPTDTVYGIACYPYNVTAIRKLYEAKRRDQMKAIPLLIADTAILANVAVEIPHSAHILGERFWPGALTLILPRMSDLPSELGGGDTIAVRLPDHSGLRDFLRSCGGTLAASSANLSGQPDAVDAQQTASYLAPFVEIIIDGGPTPGGIPSTVVDCTKRPPCLLREGAISSEAIEQVLKAG